jgi:hypothetical protein
MDPWAARFLLYRMLNDSERKDLRALEEAGQKHSPGRYLQGFEICRRYNLKVETVPESVTDQIHQLLWIWRKRYESRYDEMLSKSDGKSIEMVQTFLDELQDWINFATENYH